MILHKDMEELFVLVKFSARTNETKNKTYWCDNIELFIDYGTEKIEVEN